MEVNFCQCLFQKCLKVCPNVMALKKKTILLFSLFGENTSLEISPLEAEKYWCVLFSSLGYKLSVGVCELCLKCLDCV